MGVIVRLLNPVAEVVTDEARPAPRLTALPGRSIALMDNMKSNADVLLDRIAVKLSSAYPNIRTKRFRKPTMSALPYDPAVIEEVRSAFDALILAVGD